MTSQTPPQQPTRRSSFLRTGALFGASLVAALIFGEIVARVAVPVRNIGPTFSEYDPVYGKRLKKSFSCTRIAAEFTMQFTTNSLGFRGPEPVQFPSNSILFLGDSFTSGYGVNDEEEFPAIIRRALEHRFGQSAPPVVNAGSGNIGNGYWLKFLQQEAHRYTPQLVVFGFCVNDFLDNAVEGVYRVGGDGTLRESGVPPRQEGARTVQAVIEGIPGLAYSHLVGLARQFFSEGWGAGPAPASGQVDNSLTYALLDSTFSFCARQGLPVLLLAVEVDTARLSVMRRIAERHRIPLIEAPSKWVRPELYYHVDGHWNAPGHAAVAQLVLPYVDRVLFAKSFSPERE
jgi:lysophospholipase L1-like esterase